MKNKLLLREYLQLGHMLEQWKVWVRNASRLPGVVSRCCCWAQNVPLVWWDPAAGRLSWEKGTCTLGSQGTQFLKAPFLSKNTHLTSLFVLIVKLLQAFKYDKIPQSFAHLRSVGSSGMASAAGIASQMQWDSWAVFKVEDKINFSYL